MRERQNYTMTQADYDGLIERINAARQVSGMFLSGGIPMGNPQQAANDAWCELGNRMDFDGMSVQPGASKLQFSAVPLVHIQPEHFRSKGEDRMTTAELIAAMDAHDAEGVRLETEMTALGLDAKKIKAIRKAEAAAEKARATLRELMGEPVVAVEQTVTNVALPEVTVTVNDSDPNAQPAVTANAPAPENPKKGGK